MDLMDTREKAHTFIAWNPIPDSESPITEWFLLSVLLEMPTSLISPSWKLIAECF